MHLIDLDSLDWLFEIKINSKPLPPGYVWRVIHDPTRTAEDPGLFFGAYFRFIDIVHGKRENCAWPEGTVFENKETQEVLTIYQGRIQYPQQILLQESNITHAPLNNTESTFFTETRSSLKDAGERL